MIDETTGMPELPEGMAWRVSEEKFNSGTTLRVTLTVRKVHVVETEGIEYWQTQPKKHWYSRAKRVLVSELEEETFETWDDTRYSGNLRDSVMVRSEVDLPAGYKVISSNAWGLTAVSYDDPTPENIRKVAEKIWAEYAADQAEKAEKERKDMERKALVGMYPPMKLEGKQ